MANIAITGGSGLLAVNWALLRREIDNIFLLLNKREIFINGTKTLKTNLSSLVCDKTKTLEIRKQT